ncbi:kinase-like protein [Rhizopogon vinicolor AM-OR11-026]|uniref:non-specific serine/threonine protein kinase n=1 Tax=Rhizopogon vinicolor AM-OR11-026 TaxID=1314800 RepID=A0A1B7MQS7_9AGAM|nr:kinase-like protein [Rhizopogon vinicolor AM-OR11-026]
MVQVTPPTFPPTLADLSRNASVISSSSDTDLESPPSELLKITRPRPVRTFSSPRSRSPQPKAAVPARPPNYLTRELGVTSHPPPEPAQLQQQTKDRSKSRKRSREASRARSANGRFGGAQEFSFGDILGEGSYSTVMRARYIRTGQEYAIKILDKNHLIRKEKMLVALAEKNVLVKLGAGHPGIIHLHWTFQDEWSLFFVLDLAPNGEMQSRISRLGSLSLPCSRYYAAQIVDALQHMHEKDVIHRDLKPENLLLDADFRIKITDFGTGKILEDGAERSNTFVGTAQYVAPELLESNETSKSSDLWALGCIIYQMISGRFAFQGLSEYLTWQKIKSLDYTFPDGFDEDAKDVVQRLLVRDPSQRLGAGDTDSMYSYAALRAHPFFASVSWDTLWTDPAPKLEAGLVKKELPLAGDAEEGRWDDVGEAWDRLVGGTVDVSAESGDGISWAQDGNGTEFQRFKAGHEYVDEGPMGEIPDYLAWRARTGDGRGMPGLEEDVEETQTVVGERDASVPPPETPRSLPQAEPEPEPELEQTSEFTPLADAIVPAIVPILIPGVNGAGSGSSSSSGSPVDRVTSDLAVKLRIDSDVETNLRPTSLSRGRNRAQTPVQGNGPCSDADWSSLLLPSERILFYTRVEARSPKRRGSRLRLPISASLTKTKTRQLVLTSMRLLCVKQKKGGEVSLKSEVGFGAAGDKGKEREKPRDGKDRDRDAVKDGRNVIECAEPKGEREFVILTSTRSQTYAAETSAVSALWVEKINAALVQAQKTMTIRNETG